MWPSAPTIQFCTLCGKIRVSLLAKGESSVRLCYTLLSPTFGMHQYTADLANRAARAGHEVHLITSTRYPADRYLPEIQVHTPITTHNTGFSLTELRRSPHAARIIDTTIRGIAPDVVHFTGPHLWDPTLLKMLRRDAIPTVHTLHDLDPHPGTVYGPLLHIWNRNVLRCADHILIHAQCYHQRLQAHGIAPARLTCTPLLHLFLGHTWLDEVEALAAEVSYAPEVLFFGRLESYKGIDALMTAWAMMESRHKGEDGPRLILAGPGRLERIWAGPLPDGVELRNRLIEDAEALELFRRCSLIVLPYTGATQSALVPAAYFFRKPVMVSRSGALEEYVEEGLTGWVVEPEHPASLARCLDAALADPAALIAMGTTGRIWYEARRKAEGQALLGMYEQLANGQAAP